jgi:subtilisin family serine protease
VPAQGRNGLYYTVDGTSPACALVAGVAALMKSAYPSISPSLVTRALTSTTQRTPANGYDVLTGFGIVNAGAAMTKAGQLMHQAAAKSQVPVTAQFGGGRAAVPAAPVAPRGGGGFTLYLLLAVVSALVAAGGLLGVLKTRELRGGGGHARDRRLLFPRA